MDLRDSCRDLFQKLEREAPEGRYHVACAEGRPEWLQTFASAHHVLALRQLDAERAAEELGTVYATCQLENGLVLAEPAAEGVPALVTPPVAAFAAARLVLAGDASLRSLLQRATRELDAIWGERLPPDTDLPVILHPAESGTPDSPLYDSLVEWASPEERAEELGSLARSAVACRLDPDRALRAGHAFVVEDPVFCGWFLLALEEGQRAWEKLGDVDVARKLAIRAGMISEAISERIWSGDEQAFVGRDRQRDEALGSLTLGGMVPAASRVLLQDGKVRSAVARNLAPGGSPLWGSHGIAYQPIVRDRTPARPSPWRGNSASPSAQYWAHLALIRAGRTSDARVARGQLESALETHGFREFWDATTGEARGASHCASGTMALEMEASEAE